MKMDGGYSAIFRIASNSCVAKRHTLYYNLSYEIFLLVC